MKLPVLSASEKLAVGGSVLAIVGSLLPWLAASSVRVPGFFVGGFTALTFAVPILGILALWEWGPIQQGVTAVLGVLIVVVAANHAFAFGTRTTGVGTYVVFVAGILIAGAGVYGFVDDREPPADDAEEMVGTE